MPTYRYLLCDLLTDTLVAQLPLSGVSFDRRISRTGSLSGKLEVDSSRRADTAKLVQAYAGRSALWVYRDQSLWWGGILWTAPAGQGARGPVALDLTCATFDSYAHRRNLDSNMVYTAADQGMIIPDLWRAIQEDVRGDIGVVAEDQPTGVLRDRTYLASDLSNKVGKLIEDLGDVIDGPEHTIDVFLDSAGNRTKSLRVAQRIGSTEPRIVFQRAARGGGRVTEWKHTVDTVDGGTRFRTRGDAPNGNVGEDTEPLMSDLLERNDLLDAGWPLLDVTADYPGVTDSATLDGYAQALAAQNGGGMATSGYTVQVGNTGWSPSRLGDSVRLKLDDVWHQNEDLTVRPVGCVVTPADRGQAEQVKLLLGDED